MTLDYTEKGVVNIDMRDYVNKILNKMPDDMNGTATSPAADHLFQIVDGIEQLSEEKNEFFHATVAKLLFYAREADQISKR